MFDSVISRRGSGSYKWDTVVGDDIIERGAYPLSVADMEFRTPPEVRRAISDFSEKGFFCYTDSDNVYRDAVRQFMLRRHDFKIDNDWIVCTGGVVCAINTAIRAFTSPGDKVIIQSPVYYPFRNSIEKNERVVADNPLLRDGNTYKMDLDGLRRLAEQEDTKLMLLCSPHNPVGRVWTGEELRAVGEICLQNNVILLSDEIHFDILRSGVEHTVINNVDERFASNTVICTAVSKSFNLAGLGTSNIIIADEGLRERFKTRLSRDGYSCINCVSRPATISAYSECDYWLDAMNKYVDENILLTKSIVDGIDGIDMIECQGTYLVWLDMKGLGMDDEALDSFLQERCGIIPDPGFWFGENGKGFTRLNVACPREVLKEKLITLAEECKRIGGVQSK
jgi:putative C-S lyase